MKAEAAARGASMIELEENTGDFSTISSIDRLEATSGSSSSEAEKEAARVIFTSEWRGALSGGTVGRCRLPLRVSSPR